MARNLDDTGKHLITILRQGGQASNLITEALFKGRDDILKNITRLINSGEPMSSVLAGVNKAISELGFDVKGIMIEQGMLAGTYQAVSSVNYLTVLGVTHPTLFTVTPTFIRRSFNKVLFSQNITVNNLFTGVMANLNKDLINLTRSAFAEGLTGRQLSNLIMERATGLRDAVLRRKANALGRTAISQVANSTRFQTFDNNEDVKGVLYVATLDHRTSNVCKVLDGMFYSRRQEARVPPLHVGCRSTLVPILKGEDLDDVLDQLRRPAVEIKSVEQLEKQGLHTRNNRVRKPSQNDSSPLKGVVKQKYMTYEKWLGSQPVAYQKEILGNTAYSKFKETESLSTALGVAE